MQMRRLADAFCQQDLFLLSGAQIGHVLFHLRLWHIQLAQDGEKQTFPDPRFPGKIRKFSLQGGGILGYQRDFQSVTQPQFPAIGDVFPAQQFDQAAFAAAVDTLQSDPVPLFDGKIDTAANTAFSKMDGHILQLGQAPRVKRRLEDLQIIGTFNIFQQSGFFFNGSLLPLFDGFGTGHCLFGFCALVGTVVFWLIHL